MEKRSSIKTNVSPRHSSRQAELAFRKTIFLSALAIVVLLAALFLSLLIHSFPSIKAYGIEFLFGNIWDPVSGTFGALPFLAGTLFTSFLALLISLPFSLAIAIFIGEYFREGPLSSILKNVTELLAGIPSIIYGFWALFVLVPAVRYFQMRLGIFPYGVGIFTASLILSVMIIPYSAAIGREVIALVPSDIKEAAYSLGATRQEVITKIILPYARSGIAAGILLALGRALGETMAVTMVIGNSNLLPQGLFSPGNTMASVIANEFTEATGELYLSSLIEIGLLLFLVTMLINILGRYAIKKMSIEV
jgi:phosphate transport system permease protein